MVEPEEQIALFLPRVNDLRSRPFYKQGGGLSGSLNIARSEPDWRLTITGQINTPDEEIVRSFLLDFRKLAVSQDSPILATKVYNTCFTALPADSALRQRLMEWRQGWKQTQQQFTGGVKIGDYAVSPEEWADLWINGHYFHDDLEKAQKLQAMFGGMFSLARINFLNYLVNATTEIDNLAHLVEEAVREGKIVFNPP